MTGLRIICWARPCLKQVGHNDVGWTLHGQVEFSRGELRHASCHSFALPLSGPAYYSHITHKYKGLNTTYDPTINIQNHSKRQKL